MSNYIYIAQPVGMDGIYKVGRTKDAYARMESLKTEYKHEFELLFFDEMKAYSIENIVKNHFRDSRSVVFGEQRTEVFEVEYEEIAEFIAEKNIARKHTEREKRWFISNAFNNTFLF